MAIVENWGTGQLDLRLHRIIAEAANNALMLVMFGYRIGEPTKSLGELRQFVAAASAIERAIDEHAKIVSTLHNRDAEAAESAMRVHLTASNTECSAVRVRASLGEIIQIWFGRCSSTNLT